MKQFFLYLLILSLIYVPGYTQTYSIASPDGKISLQVAVGADIKWSATLDKIPVISPSPIALELNSAILGKNAKLLSNKKKSVNEKITPVVARKSKIIENHYNELLLTFRNNFGVAFRAYNDGVAYRFQTSFKKNIIAVSE